MSGIVDSRRALLAFLNLSEQRSADDREMGARVNSFEATFGPLRKIISAERTLADLLAPDPVRLLKAASLRTQQVLDFSLTLGLAISVRMQPRVYRALNEVLAEIFETPVVTDGVARATALEVDIMAGNVTPVPRDLLDALAVEFMRNSKVIARCALCSKFFYRTFSKDKYCSPICGEEARRKQQTAWVANERARRKQEAAKQLHLKKGRKAS